MNNPYWGNICAIAQRQRKKGIETGIKKTTIKERLKAGWSVEDVLTKPVRCRTRGYRPSGAKMDGDGNG